MRNEDFVSNYPKLCVICCQQKKEVLLDENSPYDPILTMKAALATHLDISGQETHDLMTSYEAKGFQSHILAEVDLDLIMVDLADGKTVQELARAYLGIAGLADDARCEEMLVKDPVVEGNYVKLCFFFERLGASGVEANNTKSAQPSSQFLPIENLEFVVLFAGNNIEPCDPTEEMQRALQNSTGIAIEEINNKDRLQPFGKLESFDPTDEMQRVLEDLTGVPIQEISRKAWFQLFRGHESYVELAKEESVAILAATELGLLMLPGPNIQRRFTEGDLRSRERRFWDPLTDQAFVIVLLYGSEEGVVTDKASVTTDKKWWEFWK